MEAKIAQAKAYLFLFGLGVFCESNNGELRFLGSPETPPERLEVPAMLEKRERKYGKLE